MEKKIIIATDMFYGYIYNIEGRKSTKEGG